MNRSPFAPATRRTRINRITLSALALSLLAAACSAPQPTATPMPPTRQIPDTPQPATPSPLPPRPNVRFEPQPAGVVAPIVVQRLPEAGERLRPNGVIELTFDRAMNQDSVATALKLQPAVQGAITWKNARTLSFTPAQALPRDTIIDIALTQEAKAADGAALAAPYLFRLATQGFLEVGQTIPANEAPEVQPDTIITVLFNKPVVPLTTLAQQDTLPNPVSFDPPLDGKAEWLNTSVLVFRPSKPLAGGTTYTGIVSGDLKDADGNPVQNAFRWTFSTVAPKVVSVTPGGAPDPKTPSRGIVQPENADGRVRADTAISVRFNQPIDAASARAAFSLSGPNAAAIDGVFSVLSDTLTFTPSQRLSFDTVFTARVAAGVIGASGGVAGKDTFEWKLTTVPLPAIVETTPRDGEPAAEPYTAFVIRFNTDIDPDTVMSHLTMTPALSPALVYTYFNNYDHTFVLNFNAQPDTDYEVRIDAGIADPYGNVIDESRSITFHTRNADPNGSLALPYGGATLNAYAPARVVASTMNVARLDFELYRLNDTPEALARRYYNNNAVPADSTLVRRFSQQPRGEKNRQTRTLVTLNDKNSGVLPPGAYVLRMTSPELAAQNFYQVAAIFVSEINLVLKSESGQAFVWASDLKDGAPVRDLNIDAYEYIDRGDRVEIKPIGAAVTDANGVARIARERGERSAQNAYNYAQVFAVARGARFATVFSEWQGGASPYDFGFGSLPFYGGESPVRGHVYTERAIYRAGQKVFARGVLRNQDDFSYSLPKDLKVTVTVRDAEGNTALTQPAALDPFGAFALEVPLAAGAPLGAYSIDVQASTAEGVLLGNAYANFTVAAYRAPEFEVTVTPGVSETVRGTTVETAIRAAYLSGGALRGARVRWNVLARSATFSPPQLDRYSFVDYDNPWRCFDCWWKSASMPPAQTLLSGEGVTDQNGELKLTLPISTELRDSSSELISGPVSLSIEANVTGADDQVLAGRAQVIAHPALHYVGVAFDQYVIESKKPVTAELIAVDWLGARLSGKRIEVTISRREWRSKFIAAADGIGGRWESNIDDVTVKSESVTTDANGEARVGFSAPEAGTYKIAIRSSDADARVTSAARFVWATGDEYVSWLREDNDRINLIANKTTFEQGETAEILIPSPFIDAQHSAHYALVTVERGHIVSHEVIRITNSSTVYRLPIADNHTPNVFVSVVLINSPAAPTEAADQKFGLIALRVTPRKQTLSITLTPERKLLQPGDDVTFTLRATDVSGAPVQGSFSVDLVDKGVLNLMPRQADAIVGAFYGLAGLSVGTSSGLSVSANRISEAELARQQGGLGGGGALASDAVAESAAPTGAPAPKSEAFAARSRAGQSETPAVQVRENFADTAFWRGDISTDAQGNATVSLKLPDNLTTWVMRAVGVDAQTRVGEGLADIVATKPLLIRPVAPRFLVVGDEIELSAIIINNTDQEQTATASLHVSGITLTTPPELPVTLPANGEVVVRWTAKTSDAQQADLVFLVQNEQYSDASKPRLSTAPDGGLIINRWSAPDVVGTSGDLTGAQTRTEVIAVPPGLDTTQGALTVRLDPSLAASMQDGLKYLEHFPYECAEQVVSKFLPNVLTYRALKDLGIDNPELSAALPELVKSGVARLIALQNSDGGWGWWSGEESNPNVSAYVVFGLLKARDAGFDFPAEMLGRGLEYLAEQSSDLDQRSAGVYLDWQVWLNYVLAEARMPNQAKIDALYELRGNLSQYAQALLILSIGTTDASDARIKTLFADLNANAIQSATGAHWEESRVDWWAMNTDTRTTAMVLNAIALYDKDNKLAPNVVRWLMVARKAGTGYWRSTQETAWALIALTDWMLSTGELNANYAFGAQFNGATVAEAQASRATITQTTALTIPIASLLTDVGNRLTIAKGDGAGHLYYTAHLKTYQPVPAIKAADRGIVIQRRYVKASCNDGVKCPAVTDAKVGDVLRVELTIIAPNDLHYLQVEDPLPAGGEAIDTTLATASQLDEGPSLKQNIEPGARRWWWYWGWWSRSEMRDDRVALFATFLSKGAYTYSYTMRIISAGKFNVIPAFASLQYFPEVFGRSDGALLTVAR